MVESIHHEAAFALGGRMDLMRRTAVVSFARIAAA
jgi:hypothetical protein